MDEKQKSEDILKIAKTDDQHVLPIETIEMNKPVEIKYDIVNNRDISLKILLKELIFEGLSETSLHGLPKVMKNNYHIALRVLWLIAFLTSTGYATSLVVHHFQDYYQYPTVITTKYVQEIPTKFPSVSFCNMKNPDRSRAYTLAFLNSLSAKNYYVDVPFDFSFSLYEWSARKNYAWLALMTVVDSTVRKSIGYQIEDMLVSCMFNFLQCDSSDFSYYYHPQYGDCYTFNKEMPAKTNSVPGVTYGLILELYLGNPLVDIVNNDIDGVVMSSHKYSRCSIRLNIGIIFRQSIHQASS